MTDQREIYLCQEQELDDPGCKSFALDEPALSGFLVRKDGRLRAYENRCPHTGVELNWLPDQFLDYDSEYIQCAMHGALFRIDDGACVYGPCNGQALRTLPLRVRAGKVCLLVGDDDLAG